MIPISLRISGFLSYKDPVELDFSNINLACISGSNGAGKSSILDAMTWVLFGQARKRDESILNSHPDVKMAEVVFTFEYEDQIFRVIRALPRGKTTSLEFQIQAGNDKGEIKIWRSLTEHSVRETQNRIQETLRLDYETFVNAAFFLQGKADEFAQQQPGKRKEILSNILGLEQWELFREETGELRRIAERELALNDGQIQEIDQELAEETERIEHLKTLENKMIQVSNSRKTMESNLEQMKTLAASLEHQRKLVETLKANLDRTLITRDDLVKRKESREDELEKTHSLIARAEEIKRSYEKLLDLQKRLGEMDNLAKSYKKYENETLPLLKKIETKKTNLEFELNTFRMKETEILAINLTLPGLKNEILETRNSLLAIEEKLTQKEKWNNEIQSSKELHGELKSSSENLTAISLEMKERIEKLTETEGAECPLCGQPLTQLEREKLITELENDVSNNRAEYQKNQSKIKEVISRIQELEKVLKDSQNLENERLSISNSLTKLEENLDLINRKNKEWEEQSSIYQDLIQKLEKGSYLEEVRDELEAITTKMDAIGYDAENHEKMIESVLEFSSAQQDFTALSIAEGTIKPIEDEIGNLEKQISTLTDEINGQMAKYREANDNLEEAERNKPDIASIQAELNDLFAGESQLNREIGAARQRVAVLEDQKIRKKRLEGERENSAKKIERLKTLERAFGKDGVPALLIEQALPDIETKANELLERLSDGSMSIRFLTQAAYKDKKRNDLKETLDIQIMDGSGVRDYEMFSGGEAFRVNFAIRLALSKVLSHRKGARLQTLIIDEGFGSQDNLGRQRLIEAINSVKDDFEKILIITHLDELKDTFQTQIQVTKSENGSEIRVF